MGFNMTKSIKLKFYSKLVLFMVLIIILGFVSCRRDDGDTQDGWKYVGNLEGQDREDVSVYIDLHNMVIDDNIRKFWIRYYKSSTPGSEEKYIVQIGYWEVNCNNRDLFVLGEEYYGPEGQLLGNSEKRLKEEYTEGSLGDRLSSIACRYAGRR